MKFLSRICSVVSAIAVSVSCFMNTRPVYANAEGIKIGDYIEFGHYIYNADIIKKYPKLFEGVTLPEKHVWRCVDKNEKGYLFLHDDLLSNYNLYDYDYDNRQAYYSGPYPDSSLRKALNNGFLKCFSDAELMLVKSVALEQPKEAADLDPSEKFYDPPISVSDFMKGYEDAAKYTFYDRFFIPGAPELYAVRQNIGDDYLCAKLNISTAKLKKANLLKPPRQYWAGYYESPIKSGYRYLTKNQVGDYYSYFCERVSLGKYSHKFNYPEDKYYLYSTRIPAYTRGYHMFVGYTTGELRCATKDVYCASLVSQFVRPAFYLDAAAAEILSGDGTKNSPYNFKEYADDTKIYDGEYYKEKYSDLPDFSAQSPELHSYWYGTDMPGGRTASPVYDYNYYIANNPEVVASGGTAPSDCYMHFLTEGMKQGLRASEEFDPKAYMEYNFDLYNMYGNDYEKYYEHYVKIGRSEGRSGTPTPRSSENTKGDADKNGSVNRADYMLVTKYFSGQSVSPDSEQTDIDRDGRLTRKDYIYFSKFFSGMNVPEFSNS